MALKSNKEVLVLTKPTTNEAIKLEYTMLKKAVLTLRAINHPLRKEIMELIEEKKQMTVTEISYQTQVGAVRSISASGYTQEGRCAHHRERWQVHLLLYQ
jgi:hypothetical protein